VAHQRGRLPAELARLRRYGLPIVDEVGYLPLRARGREPVLPARRDPLRARFPHPDEQPGLLRLGHRLREQAVAAAMIDRIVHHADVLQLKGASYRLKNLGIDTLPSVKAEDQTH
jgi:DNA replication protein DnaC